MTATEPRMSERRERNWGAAIRLGMRGRCPACGEPGLFRAYLKVADACSGCDEVYSHHRADDLPPYITISIVGHIVGGGILAMEQWMVEPPLWLHFSIWPTLTLALCLALLPIVKGAVVAHQWALGMHGFGAGPDPAGPEAAWKAT